jgi:RNA polymerase sigma-70 factor (ECF subfamily)
MADMAREALPSELLAALLALDLEHRTAVVLRHVLDYSSAEIAEMLEIPPPTVRTRLSRGLARMRTKLEATERRSAHE